MTHKRSFDAVPFLICQIETLNHTYRGPNLNSLLSDLIF